MMTDGERRRHMKRWMSRRVRYQWGQPPAGTNLVAHGAVACGDTCVQNIAMAVKGKRYSLDAIRRLNGAHPGSVTDANELVRALHALHLPYMIATSINAREVADIAVERGPVIVCESYGSHPEWKGYVYNGVHANRTPNGYAQPLGHAGRNQLTGDFGHWFLVMTAGPKRNAVLERDPNHASQARPERPAWDRVTIAQLDKQMRSRVPITGHVTVLIPTEVLL